LMVSQGKSGTEESRLQKDYIIEILL
jgi:hypothetical protein